MIEKCVICEKELYKKKIYLCEEHTEKALEIMQNETIKNPKHEHHCAICGEWQNRIIINYPEWLYLCDKCINDAQKSYKLHLP